MTKEKKIKQWIPSLQQEQMVDLQVLGFTLIKGKEIESTGLIGADCKLVGTNRRNWSRWCENSDFVEFLNKKRKARLSHYASNVDKAMIKAALSNGAIDRRLFYELIGEIGEARDEGATNIILNIPRPIETNLTKGK